MNNLPQTLLSSLQNSKADDALASRVTHPFATSSETTCGLLRDIIQATDQVASSLNQYGSTTFTNPKLISLLRQQAAIQHSLHLSEQNVQQTVNALRKRSTTQYGEDIPLNRPDLVDWCILRLEEWGKEVGMETFKEEKEGGTLLVFGGKVLVIDIDLSISRTEFNVQVTGVKTTYAASSSTSESSTMDGSSSLDAYLKNSLQRFFSEVQKPEETRNPVEAARLSKIVLDDLRYLVMVDKLAERKGDGGVRWFVDVDQLSSVVEDLSKREAQAIASSSGTSLPALDIFLLRSHALPLPYLSFPSLSFLIHISPLLYLTALRKFADVDTTGNQPQFDVSLSGLRSYLSDRPRGATMCTLVLSQPTETHLFEPSMSMPNLTYRPTFPLVPDVSDPEHVFPQLDLSVSSLDTSLSESSGRNIWMLDFTADGKSPGVVMSQSRMRDIELIINPLSSMETLSSVGMLSFGSGSWVDLLLNPSIPISPECYTALYSSPTSLHPPLQLRLTAPEEPGFILEKVPVHSMKEVWGVLEVVREQCWLNETLLSCQWMPEGIKMNPSNDQATNEAEIDVTEELLQSVLQGCVMHWRSNMATFFCLGTLTPRKIPVNVFIPSSSSDPLFESTDLESITKMQKPRIMMSSPERPPISGLVAITVTYDESKPRGVGVDISGAIGADLRPDVLEEICRRGGTLSLPGRVWIKSVEM
ncbi:hypothetical protein L218DRAFT_863517 [Marasmius fiardii PR-910]|nr:hypothetical protein L218DRAFT_863517 [Marasmius fiardii PR-910]